MYRLSIMYYFGDKLENADSKISMEMYNDVYRTHVQKTWILAEETGTAISSKMPIVKSL